MANRSVNVSNLVFFGLPLLCFIGLAILPTTSTFQKYKQPLSIGISIDFLLTVPLVFLFLIRNSKIPKTTVVPLLVLGMLLGYTVLPKENQLILDYFKSWILPLIELGVLSFLGFSVYRSAKRFKNQRKKDFDFYTTLKAIGEEILPKVPAALLTSELAVLYYGLWTWKKRPLVKHEFSYHKNSGTLTVLAAFICIIGMETYVFHIILAKWNNSIAWILTGMSCYTVIQIFGFLKSMARRPISIDEHTLYLRYGIMGEAIIPLNQIAAIERNNKELDAKKFQRKLSFLGAMESHNIVLRVKEPMEVLGLYGSSKKYQVLGFYVDQPALFKKLLDERLESLKTA